MVLAGSGECKKNREGNINNCVLCFVLNATLTYPAKEYRHIFSLYPTFNALQSQVLDDILYSDNQVVVSAPTGSGKTVIFELAIIHLLMQIRDHRYCDDFSIVYLAPVKALCSERYQDWQSKFSALGLTCQEVTGDSNISDLSELSLCNIILTTPEKWDSLTRNWRSNTRKVKVVKLFLIDEVHILNEERRGPVMEAVVSRMKTIQEFLALNSDEQNEYDIPLRFIAVSATIPNIEDVACWLGSMDNPALSWALGEEYRPVKLTKIVLGYDCPSHFSQFRFEIQLSYKIRPLLFKYSEQKPSLIFCSTRKGVIQTTDVLSKQITFHFSLEQKQRLLECTRNMRENKLKDYILAGVGCHHAGMDVNDRHIVENLFRNGFLPVLVTTSTLAMGVNLPAHLVIIKSTQHYAGGCYQDYSENQILQMMGRAGRPQFDTQATTIIMTRNNQVNRYRRLVESKDLLESNLLQHLAEHLNSEVVLSTITEKAQAINWIRSTFLYVRTLKNPKYYGISAELSKKGIEDKLQEICLRELNALASINLVKMDVYDIHPTQTGRLMAQFYIAFETMKIFTKISGSEKLYEMLAILTSCHEFADFQLRTNEKRALNALNQSKTGIRFPLPNLIKTREMKVNCLVQASFGCLPIPDPSLHQDSIRIIRTGQRITSCMAKYLSMQPHYSSLLNAIILAKCFRCNLWENSNYVSRQLERIGPVLSACLVAAGKTNFQAIAESNPRDLERILNRPSPMGDRVRYAAAHLPRYSLHLEREETQVHIRLLLDNIEAIELDNTAGLKHRLHLLVGDSNNKLLLHKKFQDSLLVENGGHCEWTVGPLDWTKITEVVVNVVSEEWVGLDVTSSTSVNPSVDNSQAIPVAVQKKIGKYIESSQKSGPTRAKKSILSQLHDISNGVIQSIGNKRLRTSFSATPGQISLDRFIYTPSRNKKLSPESHGCYNSSSCKERDNYSSADCIMKKQLEKQIMNRNLTETHLLNSESDQGKMSNTLKQPLHTIQQQINLPSVSPFCAFEDSGYSYTNSNIQQYIPIENKIDYTCIGVPDKTIHSIDKAPVCRKYITQNKAINLNPAPEIQCKKQSNKSNKLREEAMRKKTSFKMEISSHQNSASGVTKQNNFNIINLKTGTSESKTYSKELQEETVRNDTKETESYSKIMKISSDSQMKANGSNVVHSPANFSKSEIYRYALNYNSVSSSSGTQNTSYSTNPEESLQVSNSQSSIKKAAVFIKVPSKSDTRKEKFKSKYYPIFLGALKEKHTQPIRFSTEIGQLCDNSTGTTLLTDWKVEDLQIPCEINFDLQIERLILDYTCVGELDETTHTIDKAPVYRKYTNTHDNSCILKNKMLCSGIETKSTSNFLPLINSLITSTKDDIQHIPNIPIKIRTSTEKYGENVTDENMDQYCKNNEKILPNSSILKTRDLPLRNETRSMCKSLPIANTLMANNKDDTEYFGQKYIPITTFHKDSSESVSIQSVSTNDHSGTIESETDKEGIYLPYRVNLSQQSDTYSQSPIWGNQSQVMLEDIPFSWVSRPIEYIASSGFQNTQKNECCSPPTLCSPPLFDTSQSSVSSDNYFNNTVSET
ncbi:probable ATP-dependent DNA helicase HFM1 [Anabrus simplex]|uniref:probable ATP-dependent DNA helicase HFM1 n=1 Tax=Anabrus simplex TaxID=316456 RepID=UPI0035A2A31F